MKRKVMEWMALRLCRALRWVPMTYDAFDQTYQATVMMRGYRDRRYGTKSRFDRAA